MGIDNVIVMADWLARHRPKGNGSSGAPAVVDNDYAPNTAFKVRWDDLPKLPDMWKPEPPDPGKFPSGTPRGARPAVYTITECVSAMAA